MLLRLPWAPRPQPPPILTLEDVERISAANAAAVVSSTLATIESRPEVQFARRNAAMSQAFAMSNPDPFRTNADPQFRPLSNVSVATLRTLARSYDVLAACIAHLKDQVIRTPLQIVAKDDKDKSKATAAAIDEAQQFFDVEGGLGGAGEYLQDFEGKWLDDLIVIGCMALTLGYKTVGSKADTNPDTIQAIDSSTIKPLVTPAGFAPELNQPAYDQYVMGTQHGRYTRDEIIYRSLPIFNRNDTPYATSAVELLVMVVSTALQSDNWNRTWLTDGNVPDMLVVTPETWTPQQIIEYQDYFDAILAGNSRQRHKAKLVPHGTTSTSQTRKDADFQAFESWLRDRTASLMGVNPTSIGYGGNTYKVSQEGANDQTRENRVAQLLMFRAALYTDICRRKGWAQLVVKDKETDTEDALSKAQRFQILINSGQRTIDECRQSDGEEPLPDNAGATPLLAAGMVTLDSVLNPPEPVAPPMGPGAVPGGDSALGGSNAQDGPPDGKGGGSGTPPKPKGGPPKIMTALRADSLSRADLSKWERKALNRIRDGKPAACRFESDAIDEDAVAGILARLGECDTADDVRRVFDESEPRDDSGKWTSGGDSGEETAPATRTPPPQLSHKAQRAKDAHHMVDKSVQRYTEDHNEPRFARAIKGVSFPDSEPVDVVAGKGGVVAHGVELKTIVDNKAEKLTMDRYAQVRKINWERDNNAAYHTVVIDDQKVYNANGPGQHDESQRVYYYRRGVAGSARISAMHKAKDLKEVQALMKMPEADLPPAARRTDAKNRDGTWKFFTDAQGKGYKNSKTGDVVRPKK